MRAMFLKDIREPLRDMDWPIPQAGPGQIVARVGACAICRTDLHVLDGELPNPKLPLVLGHEIVGTVIAQGEGVERFAAGDRIGIPWLGWTCGACRYCEAGQENLCDEARFTGYTLDGGFAEYVAADARFCFSLPAFYADAEAAPLLCAGLIGYRTLKKAGDAERIGIYGFGAAAHLVVQIARYQGRQIFAFTRPGDKTGQEFALQMGAAWAGDSDGLPPAPLDAALIFAPVGELIPRALRAVRKGGIVVCGGIHMSDVPSFPYSILWEERTICSVANLTRKDGEEFLALAPRIPIRCEIQRFALRDSNEAIARLRRGGVKGAVVLIPGANAA